MRRFIRNTHVSAGDPTPPTLQEYVRTADTLTCPIGGRSSRRRETTDPHGLVSIVTATFNSVKALPRTMDSIASQAYPHIEYIVIDGGSSDGTLDLLRQRSDEIDLWLSERDRGISDAFNKGIALAHGEFIALVNSDDWIEPDHVARAVEFLQQEDADFIFGDIMVHAATGSPLYTTAGEPMYARRIRHGMPDLNHPSIICRREVYERYGLYRRDLRIAMDYEWLLRGHMNGIRGKYVPGLTSHMLDGGVSKRQVLKSLTEVREVSIRYSYPRTAAWFRFLCRVTRSRVRQLMERWISQKLAYELRTLIHPGCRPWSSQ